MLSGATGLCLLSRNFTDNRSCLGDSTLANKPKLKTNTSVRRYYNGFTSETTKAEQTSPSLYVSSDLIKDRLLMEQEVWISKEERHALYGKWVGPSGWSLVPHLDPTFHPDQTTLFGVLYTRGLIYGWMVAFEDNATGVPVSPTPHKLFQDRATAAGSWSCVLPAALARLAQCGSV